MSRRMIDSHLHLWDLTHGGYSWLRPEHGPLHRSFGPDEARDVLAAAGIGSAVLVQAEDSARDTAYLLEVARTHDFVAGVVGWVPLDDPSTAERQLDELAGQRAFVGVRHLVHDDPRADFLAIPEVRRSLGLLAERGLPFDVPDAWPVHLAATAELADALPELRIVVDHLGKPPRGTDDLARWEAAFRDVAARPNTVAKVSGLQRAGQPFTADALRPVLDIALDAFGSARLMYGGDWPMTVPAGGYQPFWVVIDSLLSELAADEQEDLWHRTATRVYGLQGGTS
jgi:L-fuconolactonase